MNRAQLFRLIRGGNAPPGEVPVNSVAPTLDAPEPPRVGDTYTGETGTWSGSPTSYVYIFQRSSDGVSDWSDIDGATGQTYVADLSVTGVYVRYGEKASNLYGTALAFVYSDAIGPVLAASSGGGGAGGTDYPYAPVVRDRTVYRTPLVAQDQEFIDFQREVAIPQSPTATVWNATGADLAWFDQVDGGLVFKAATRASIPKGTTLSIALSAENAHGTSSAPAMLYIKIPLDEDCRFCDFDAGVDAGVGRGLTPSAPWKQIPRSLNFAGTQVTLGANKVVFFRGGVHHRYSLIGSLSGFTAMEHTGTTGNPFVISGTGWGTQAEGRAIIDGADVISSWTAVTEEEVDGNPNWSFIRKLDLTNQGGAAGIQQQIIAGDTLLYPAQSPRPVNPMLFEGPDDITESQGMWRATITTNTSISPRMSRSGTTLTVQDDRIRDGDARTPGFGSTDPTGMPLQYWGVSNFIGYGEILTYDSVTSTITATCPSALVSGSSIGAYSIQFHPKQIAQAGQYALSTDRLTVYAWLPNAETTAISRRNRGYQANAYSTFCGFIGQAFSSPRGTAGGMFISHGASAIFEEITITDNIIRYCRSEDGNGVIHGSGGSAGSTGWSTSIIERTHMVQNPKCSGIRLANLFRGYVGGTVAQVVGNATGKIRWNFADSYGIGQTYLLLNVSDGVHIYENGSRDLFTVHGNGFSPYSDTVTYVRNCVIENNFFDNTARCVTTSVINATVDRFNTYRRNVFLGSGTGYMGLWSGEPGSTFQNNIIMGAESFTYATAMMIGAGERVTITGNVIGGIVVGGGAPSSNAYTITDNLLMVDACPPNDGPTRVVADNDVDTEAASPIWNRTISPAMAAKLGPGDIGLFWNVAA